MIRHRYDWVVEGSDGQRMIGPVGLRRAQDFILTCEQDIETARAMDRDLKWLKSVAGKGYILRRITIEVTEREV